MKERDIFDAALAIPDPEKRRVFLAAACAGDTGLEQHLRNLLAAERGLGSFLEEPAAAPTLTMTPPRVAEGVGTVIGPYKLLEAIGEGGMGTVYMAEQTAPVRRKVALKVIKPGMETKQVIARFEAERQALALMDHPNIAKVLDAGTTEAGRPYFVMELVRGIPITDYCDREHLSISERLGLFVAVCRAVQHAHQKGVIHRDIKPSNVLVTLHDGVPVPKVIDFGIAKATGQSLTDRTLYTGFAQLVGTPLYMSPEQAELSGLDVDTRSDVYSLGVLLYELLTGTTPFDQEALRKAALDEVRRIIREEEPRKPSTRLSSLGATLTTVSAKRKLDPRHLQRTVRGELDWIVMKALEKDRRRRYATANDFAADVMHYLTDDPVEAGPPSAWYKARKLARRNRAALVTGGAFLLLLFGSATVSTYLAIRANQALAEAKGAKARTDEALKVSEESGKQAKAVSEFLIVAFRSPDPTQDGRQVKVADVLDRAVAKLEKEVTGSPATKGALFNALGETYHGLGLYDKAVPTHGKARALRESSLGPDHPDTLTSRDNLGEAYRAAGRTAEALALHEANLKLRESKLGPDHPDTLTSRDNLASAYDDAGRPAEAIRLHKETLELRESKLGPDHRDTLTSRNNLAIAYANSGRLSEATPLFEATLKLHESKLGPDHPDTLCSRNNLAQAYLAAGRTAEAITMHEGTLKLCEPRLGHGHPHTLVSRDNLAMAYRATGRTTEAIRLHEGTLKLLESNLGPDHPDTLVSRNNLATAYNDAGRTAEAITMHEGTLKLLESKLGHDHSTTLASRNNLAAAYESLSRWADAEALRRDGLARRRKAEKPDSPVLGRDLAGLGANLLKQAKWSEAEPLLREALAIRMKAVPDDWSRFNTMSQLGGALVGQAKYAEAEPLLIEGYEGMQARAAKIPASARSRLREAAECIIRLHEARDRPEAAAAWRTKLGAGAGLPNESTPEKMPDLTPKAGAESK